MYIRAANSIYMSKSRDLWGRHDHRVSGDVRILQDGFVYIGALAEEICKNSSMISDNLSNTSYMVTIFGHYTKWLLESLGLTETNSQCTLYLLLAYHYVQ